MILRKKDRTFSECAFPIKLLQNLAWTVQYLFILNFAMEDALDLVDLHSNLRTLEH